MPMILQVPMYGPHVQVTRNHLLLCGCEQTYESSPSSLPNSSGEILVPNKGSSCETAKAVSVSGGGCSNKVVTAETLAELVFPTSGTGMAFNQYCL